MELKRTRRGTGKTRSKKDGCKEEGTMNIRKVP